jgi:hypothetical protein
MDPERFVFIDETATTTNMTRRYGRCPSNQRLVAKAPHGHWKTTTFVAGLRKSGITAPLVLDGPMTGSIFRAYAEQFLAPTLEPGDVVVMDNLSAHKVERPPGHRERRRVDPPSAALQSPSQSPRTGLRQAQGHPAPASDRPRPGSGPRHG